MKPVPSTLETRRMEMIAAAAKVLADPTMFSASVLQWHTAVASAGPDSTVEQVRDAVRPLMHAGEPPPRSVSCDGCDRMVDRVVRVGQEPDYDSRTADLCADCLREALAALEAAP